MPEPPPRRPKLSLGKPLPPAAAQAIARVSGADLAAAKARPVAPAPPPRARSAAVPPRALKEPPPTKQSAAKQRSAWRVADLATCRERFPAVFNPARPIPLALGVHVELGKMLGVKRAERVLHEWTRWRPYVEAVAAGGMRYRLDGTEAGPVDARHQALAQAALAAPATRIESPQREAA